jgi:DNA-binding NarL/FixJ family response regulator
MGEHGKARTLIVDAQPVMRDGLAANLAGAGLEIVDSTGDPEEAIEAAARHRPDVVLLDLSLVARHGEPLLARLRESSPAARIIILSSLEDEALIAKALRHGADAHLRKDVFSEELIAAILSDAWPPAAGGPDGTGSTGAGANRSLSPREAEVLQLIARGESDAEIAEKLGASLREVRSHVTTILRKMGARGRTEAAIRALREGDIHF